MGGFQQLLFILKMALGLICKYENDVYGSGMNFVSLKLQLNKLFQSQFIYHPGYNLPIHFTK